VGLVRRWVLGEKKYEVLIESGIEDKWLVGLWLGFCLLKFLVLVILLLVLRCFLFSIVKTKKEEGTPREIGDTRYTSLLLKQDSQQSQDYTSTIHKSLPYF